MQLPRFLRTIDWTLLLPAIFLTVFGLVSICGISVTNGDFLHFKKQLIFWGAALLLMVFFSWLDLRFLRANSYLVFSLYLLALLGLAGVLLFGSQIRGMRGWYQMGFLSLSPVPFAAIVLIIFLSKYFSRRHIELKSFRPIIVSGLYAFLPVLLVILEPDLGSALGLAAVWFGIVVFSGIRMRHFLLLLLLFIILFAAGWQFWLMDYQKQRVLSFLNPQADKHGIAWNTNQSKIAIGSGGLLGKGIGKGSQTQYGFLPEPKTDFIFSAIAEETGFVGAFSFLAIFTFLLWRILKAAFLAPDNFTRLFASGLAFFILSQVFINVGMCLGILPVIGIPLPFVSYGGSQLWASYLSLGILMGLKRRG